MSMPFLRKSEINPDINKGFTLAEVLITLGIIGVVAAMTLPTLIQNHQKQVLLSQLKKNYAIVNQAVQMMKAEYGNVDIDQMPFVGAVYNHSKSFNTRNFAEVFTKYLPSTWDGEIEGGNFCFQDMDKYNVKGLGGGISGQVHYGNTNTHSWILNNGACINFLQTSGWEFTESAPVTFRIDVNGNDKNPNTFGKDIFVFELYPNGALLPKKYQLTKEQLLTDWGACRPKSGGEGCAALIMMSGWSYPREYPAWK